MKIVGQDEDGRIVIDFEGEEIKVERTVPGESPVVVMNALFTFVGKVGDKGGVSFKPQVSNTRRYKEIQHCTSSSSEVGVESGSPVVVKGCTFSSSEVGVKIDD